MNFELIENEIDIDNKDIEEAVKRLKLYINRLENYESSHKMGQYYKSIQQAIEDILKTNETYKKQYFGLIDKIENKIDKFDYEFNKAKRKNDNDRADYYWDLIINFKKILENEE